MTLALTRYQDTTTLSPSFFKLHRFVEGGYAITFLDTLVELDYSVTPIFNEGDQLLYTGVLHLWIKNQDGTKSPVPLVPSLNKMEPDLDWVGIPSKRFYPYRKWINKDGTCGMYTAAVLLSYYKDYLERDLLPDSLHPFQSEDGDKLIMAMKVYIHSLSFRGTIAYDISWGINRFFRDYKVNHKLGYSIKAISHIAPTFGTVSSRLDAPIPKPVIVGTYSWLGAPKNYKNHWVVAYSYAQKDDERYYRVHDNHGRHKAVINVKWTVSSIRLQRTML